MGFGEISDEFEAHFDAWLRIEPRCRQDDFARGIQARTADPLWILTRQWQTGEFKGEDAGSPIRVEMRYETQSIDCVKLGDQESHVPPVGVPLETIVEQELNEVDYRERVRIGQEFERRLRTKWAEIGITENVDDFIDNLRAQESIKFPKISETSMHSLDHATQRFVNFMRGRVIDGLVVLEGPIPVPSGSPIPQSDFDSIRDEILIWFSQVCKRPIEKKPPAWQSEKLDYRFEVNNYPSFPKEGSKLLAEQKTKLAAPDYRNGDIDWYTFSAGSAGVRGPWEAPSNPKLNPLVTTPTRIEVTGTSPRWWAFEDGNTDFGAMDVAKPDLAKMLLMEFALIYGDDWFSVPAPVSTGSLVRIKELKVWNVFGEETSIGPARKVYPEETDWTGLQNTNDRPTETLPNLSRFDLFTLSGANPQIPSLDVRMQIPNLRQEEILRKGVSPFSMKDTPMPTRLKLQPGYKPKIEKMIRKGRSYPLRPYRLTSPHPILFIPPVTGFRQESSPVDEVHFLRDEGANIMWGIENTVPNNLGRPMAGFDAQRERNERWRDPLMALLSTLNRLIEFGAPSEPELGILEQATKVLQNQIADLSPNAQQTPSQNEIPRYRLATTVPENWIPFIPVRRGSVIGAKQATIQFRRGKMLRNTDHRKMEDAPPLTLTHFLELHQALDDDPSMTLPQILSLIQNNLASTSPHPFALDESIPSMSRLLALDEDAMLFINEESVPRAGLRVQITKQRARSWDGSTHVWLGRKVLTGRGEGNSGLRFDCVK